MIRAARPEDAAAVTEIVAAAYGPLAARMKTPPAPMLDDYATRVGEGVVDVFVQDDTLLGMIILIDRSEALLLENVAVAPTAQGQGIGRALVVYAEAEAHRRGFDRIRLYTHATMVENQAMYRHLGFVETSRGIEHGYDRVQFEKRL